MEKKNWAIVDDDPIFHIITQNLIEKKDVCNEIFLFGNGKEAIDYLEEHEDSAEDLPDVVFLDLSMPVMDGWDFIDEYLPMKNEFPKDIIIYIVSSSVDQHDIERAKKISAIEKYIVKPIDQSELEEIIDNLKAA